MQASPQHHLLALDVGSKRIGVAIADAQTPFARPLTTLDQSAEVVADITDLVRQYQVAVVVVGLPRNLQGEPTKQTKAVEDFAASLGGYLSVPIAWQDEALTSVKAEDELAARGKAYNKSDVDALAATYILEDYIAEHPRSVHV